MSSPPNSRAFRLAKPGARHALPARLPRGLRIYAIGDVHGRSDLLGKLVARIDRDMAKHPMPHMAEVYLGDYVDRGPASRKVLDMLIARRRVRKLICLKGNHEAFVADFIRSPKILGEWQRYGGLQTLVSYGLAPAMNVGERRQIELALEFKRALPESHRQFLRNLRPSFTCGDFFFVHAGVRPGIPLARQREEDLLWIREDFLEHEEQFGKIVVHGHTPVMRPEVHANRINIDTGAYATGQLTCLVLEADNMFFL